MEYKKEYIISAAVYINDGKIHLEQPDGIETGFVVTGRRHVNCYMTISIISKYTYECIPDRKDQGFITSKNRYVGRKEAFLIAKEAGQLLHNLHDVSNLILNSEDIY